MSFKIARTRVKLNVVASIQSDITRYEQPAPSDHSERLATFKARVDEFDAVCHAACNVRGSGSVHHLYDHSYEQLSAALSKLYALNPESAQLAEQYVESLTKTLWRGWVPSTKKREWKFGGASPEDSAFLRLITSIPEPLTAKVIKTGQEQSCRYLRRIPARLASVDALFGPKVWRSFSAPLLEQLVFPDREFVGIGLPTPTDPALWTKAYETLGLVPQWHQYEAAVRAGNVEPVISLWEQTLKSSDDGAEALYEATDMFHVRCGKLFKLIPPTKDLLVRYISIVGQMRNYLVGDFDYDGLHQTFCPSALNERKFRCALTESLITSPAVNALLSSSFEVANAAASYGMTVSEHSPKAAVVALARAYASRFFATMVPGPLGRVVLLNDETESKKWTFRSTQHFDSVKGSLVSPYEYGMSAHVAECLNGSGHEIAMLVMQYALPKSITYQAGGRELLLMTCGKDDVTSGMVYETVMAIAAQKWQDAIEVLHERGVVSSTGLEIVHAPASAAAVAGIKRHPTDDSVLPNAKRRRVTAAEEVADPDATDDDDAPPAAAAAAAAAAAVREVHIISDDDEGGGPSPRAQRASAKAKDVGVPVAGSRYTPRRAFTLAELTADYDAVYDDGIDSDYGEHNDEDYVPGDD